MIVDVEENFEIPEYFSGVHIDCNGTEHHYSCGVKHRIDGPAVVRKDNGHCGYYLFGIPLNGKEDFDRKCALYLKILVEDPAIQMGGHSYKMSRT